MASPPPILFTTISYTTVSASLSLPRPANTPTSRANSDIALHDDLHLCCTNLFNTHNHTLSNLLAALPPTHQHHNHHPPKSTADPFAFSTWLPLIAHTQRISPAHITTLALTSTAQPALLTAHARWLRTGTLSDSVVQEAVEEWGALSAFFAGDAPRGEPGAREGGAGHFVRLDACSAKDSAQHPVREPVRCAGDVVRALVGSMRAAAGGMGAWDERGGQGGHGGRTRGKRAPTRLCIVPWNARMDGRRVFRVFVPPAMGSSRGESGEETRGLRIAAMSQYRWHEAYRAPWDGVGVEKTARRLVEGAERLLGEIVAFAARLSWEGEEHDIVKKTLLHVLDERGFVFDVVAMEEGAGGGGDDDGDYEVQLVELNPFGATTGCGSLLFHWIKDVRVLYGLEEQIRLEFRVALDR